ESLLAVLGLAKIAFTEGDVDGAMRLTEQAVANHPSSNQALLLKADLLRSQNKTEAALTAYADAIKLDPEHVPAYISKANLEISSGNLDAAAKDIEAARKVGPGML